MRGVVIIVVRGPCYLFFFFNEPERTGLWIKRGRTGREKATGRAAGFRRRFCRVSPSAGRAENLPRFFHVRKRIGDSFFFLNFISQLTSKPFYTERALDTLIVFEDPRSSRSRKPLKPFYWYSPVIGHSCEYFHTQKSNWLFFFFLFSVSITIERKIVFEFTVNLRLKRLFWGFSSTFQIDIVNVLHFPNKISGPFRTQVLKKSKFAFILTLWWNLFSTHQIIFIPIEACTRA